MAARAEEGNVAKAPHYEIELDLSTWKALYTHQVPKLPDDLFRALPTLKEDTGRSGKEGGFTLELQKGTSLAHVIEHVILALIRLAKGDQGPYSGWTRRLNQGRRYVIHYSAPDFLTARLAALLAIGLVKRLVAGEPVEGQQAVQWLKQPQSYFSAKAIAGVIEETGEPVGVIQALTGGTTDPFAPSREGTLSGERLQVVVRMLKEIRHQLGSIAAAWRESFLAYGGTYGAAILDKLALLNLDGHFVPLVGGNLPKVLGEVKRTARLLASYRIPETFVVHSLWLYKNKLMSAVMDKHKYHDAAPVDIFIKAFEELYQILLRHVLEGYAQCQGAAGAAPAGEFKKFIELNPCRGRILVIDDDEMIRRVVGDVLELHGYQILLAQSAVQALEMLSEGQGELLLVILDVHRPDDLEVPEAYERIRALSPAARFIVTSGLSVPQELEAFLNAQSIAFLKKPFTVNFLMNKIESLHA